MDKRLQERKGVSKIVVDISDGYNFFPGVVNNISHSGLVVGDVSHELKHREETLSLTVSSNGQRYRLRAIPRWVSETGHKKTVGVKIFSVPRDWFKFVDNL